MFENRVFLANIAFWWGLMNLSRQKKCHVNIYKKGKERRLFYNGQSYKDEYNVNNFPGYYYGENILHNNRKRLRR